MQVNSLSTCFVTSNVKECKDFYQKHFEAKVTFDCGWYTSLNIPGNNSMIQFMEPQNGAKEYSGVGIMINFNVDDVDLEYEKLKKNKVSIVMPIEDHPWGDRGFSVADPIGNMLYIYSAREPAEEFKKFYL